MFVKSLIYYFIFSLTTLATVWSCQIG